MVEPIYTYKRGEGWVTSPVISIPTIGVFGDYAVINAADCPIDVKRSPSDDLPRDLEGFVRRFSSSIGAYRGPFSDNQERITHMYEWYCVVRLEDIS